eukprot:scaffold78431_cov15-Tisochrysis_lutea.AAC.1
MEVPSPLLVHKRFIATMYMQSPFGYVVEEVLCRCIQAPQANRLCIVSSTSFHKQAQGQDAIAQSDPVKLPVRMLVLQILVQAAGRGGAPTSPVFAAKTGLLRYRRTDLVWPFGAISGSCGALAVSFASVAAKLHVLALEKVSGQGEKDATPLEINPSCIRKGSTASAGLKSFDPRLTGLVFGNYPVRKSSSANFQTNARNLVSYGVCDMKQTGIAMQLRRNHAVVGCIGEELIWLALFPTSDIPGHGLCTDNL